MNKEILFRIILNNNNVTHERFRKMLIFSLLLYLGGLLTKITNLGSTSSCEIPKGNVTFVRD